MSDTLHPNLARIAASYDQILEQLSLKQLTNTEALAKIAQLEARDDNGTRWSIDPNTGDFVRHTAFGELEVGTPPAFGVASADPFSVSDPNRPDNPNLRLDATVVGTFSAPMGMAGATRGPGALSQASEPTETSSLRHRIQEAPPWAILTVSGVAVALIAGLLWAGLGGTSDPVPTSPDPAVSAPATPVAKGTNKKHKKVRIVTKSPERRQ